MGYDLVVANPERLVIASGRLLGDSAQKIKILDGLALEQGRELGQVLIESKYETIYQVPVTVITDDKKMQLAPREALTVTVQDKAYQVMIHQSSKVVPSKEYEGVVEGSGYVLEYIAVTK